jgi:hypothetical protein
MRDLAAKTRQGPRKPGESMLKSGAADNDVKERGVCMKPTQLTASETAAVQEMPERREGQGPDRRQSVVDRRSGLDRRQKTREESGYTGPERRSGIDRRIDTGLERRRGPGRRRSDDRKAAEEGEMTAEQFEFVMAIETYKKVNKKMFPTWTEVLEVISQLGYRKVEGRTIQLSNVPEPQLSKVA